MMMVLVQMGRVDVLSQQNSKKESALPWTDVFQRSSSSSLALGKQIEILQFCSSVYAGS